MKQKFNYDFAIEANDRNEANQTMSALTTLCSKLSSNELAKLAHIVKNDPIKTAMAKQYLGV